MSFIMKTWGKNNNEYCSECINVIITHVLRRCRIAFDFCRPISLKLIILPEI